MNIADRIKRLRELFGITSNEFAKITDIHPVSIRKYETNKMVPGIDVIDKMCEALKLPRMIFEGFPKQHTDYQFAGDFYQQLFLLLDNQTLSVNKDTEDKEGKTKHYFTLNPELAKYVVFKQNGKEIPFNDLTFEIKHNSMNSFEHYDNFLMYLDSLECIQNAKNKPAWRDKSETRAEYIARIAEMAEEERFDLMLTGHSWKQYMEGWVSADTAREAVYKEMAAGGDFYTYVEKLDAPESEKTHMIQTYERAYIEELIQMPEYPGGKDSSEKLAWIRRKMDLIEAYMAEHPDYPELARQHARESAEAVRKEMQENS